MLSDILFWLAVILTTAGVLILTFVAGHATRRADDRADAIDFEAVARRIPVRQEALRRHTLTICLPGTPEGRALYTDRPLSRS